MLRTLAATRSSLELNYRPNYSLSTTIQWVIVVSFILQYTCVLRVAMWTAWDFDAIARDAWCMHGVGGWVASAMQCYVDVCGLEGDSCGASVNKVIDRSKERSNKRSHNSINDGSGPDDQWLYIYSIDRKAGRLAATVSLFLSDVVGGPCTVWNTQSIVTMSCENLYHEVSAVFLYTHMQQPQRTEKFFTKPASFYSTMWIFKWILS